MKKDIFTVGGENEGQTAFEFLKTRYSGKPLAFLYKIFRKKDAKVNGKAVAENFVLNVGDEVAVFYSETDSAKNRVSNFTVIYEDNNVIVVNKPANILVNEGGAKTDLTASVNAYISAQNERQTAIPVHRLDRNTTGAVIFAKNKTAEAELLAAFKNHGGIEKTYSALVFGNVTQGGVIDAPLSKNEKDGIVSVDFKNGKTAVSKYEVAKNYGENCALLEISIITGRTHQIRAHMNYIGHPILGDTKYGSKASDELAKSLGIKRYVLHAKRLVFSDLGGSLKYLNGRVFEADLHDWQMEILNRL